MWPVRKAVDVDGKAWPARTESHGGREQGPHTTDKVCSPALVPSLYRLATPADLSRGDVEGLYRADGSYLVLVGKTYRVTKDRLPCRQALRVLGLARYGKRDDGSTRIFRRFAHYSLVIDWQSVRTLYVRTHNTPFT